MRSAIDFHNCDTSSPVHTPRYENNRTLEKRPIITESHSAPPTSCAGPFQQYYYLQARVGKSRVSLKENAVFRSRNLVLRTAKLVIACSWLLLHQPTAQAQKSGRDVPYRPSVLKTEVNKAVELATGYLDRSCGADGRFTYKVTIGTARESSSYDIIRHEGAIYGLAMANRGKVGTETANVMIRAAEFLRQNYMGRGPRQDQMVIWSKPLTELPEGQFAELGGSGLGLVSLAAAKKVEPKAITLRELRGLARFVLFLQRDDGSFVSKYREEGGAVPHWNSLYYPGEAALGLISLYKIDPSREWLAGAAKALGFLARSRAGLSNVPADHWALIATAELLPYIDKVGSLTSKRELITHAVQICNSILREQFHGGAPSGLDGAFDPNGRIAPAATRLEGLLSALAFLPEGELRDRTLTSVARGISFLLRAQLISGPQIGGMPGAIVRGAPDSHNIRIDYVQHALCAWLRYQKLLQTTDQSSPSR